MTRTPASMTSASPVAGRPASPDRAITTRQATAGDAALIAGLFAEAYAQTTHPCSDVDFLHDSLRSGSESWIVGEYEGEPVGCLAAVKLDWPGVVDLCRAITSRRFAGRGVARSLYTAAAHAARAFEDCDVLYGTPRCLAIKHLTLTCRVLPLHVVGHDAGAHQVNKRWEHHLVTVALTPRGRLRRAAIPAGRDILLRQSRLERVGEPRFHQPITEPAVVEPPPRAGWKNRHAHLYDALDAEIVRSHPSFDLPPLRAHVHSELARLRDVRRVSAYVRADRPDVVAAFQSAGLIAHAYLPGWHVTESGRHDCVWMSRVHGDDTVTPAGFESDVADWSRRLHLAAQAAQGQARASHA